MQNERRASAWYKLYNYKPLSFYRTTSKRGEKSVKWEMIAFKRDVLILSLNYLC